MGALNPLFLLAGVAVALPIYLHLFHRNETRRIAFPALRYLERTERERARQIRLRQILLMLARVAAIALLVGAGARLFFGGRGAAHPPTATVLVIDNSMSSGLVKGEARLLDEVKEVARRTLALATDEDRFWVLRAGEPWLPAIPGSASEAFEAVEATEPSDAEGDLTAALARARALLESSTLPHREIHLLSDLQATAFDSDDGDTLSEIPVVVWTGHEAPQNRAIVGVDVGGGLAPLEGDRSELTVTSLDHPVSDSTAVPVRLVVNERIRGATTLPPGAAATISVPPSGSGWIVGYADADPDALRADDRRYFSYRSRQPPRLALAGDPGVFVAGAADVLADAGRVVLGVPPSVDVLVAAEGSGLETRGPSTSAVITPPSDPTLIPALNRRLTEAGIPWRFSPSSVRGTAELAGALIPSPLVGVEVYASYELSMPGDPPGPVRTLAEAAGAAWAVDGFDATGRRYLVIASPLDASASTLPVSTGMLRLMDWVVGEWSGGGSTLVERTTGSHLPAPPRATHVRFPSGEVEEVDGTRVVRTTGAAGFYTFLEADTVVSVSALNPPAIESVLDAAPAGEYSRLIGNDISEAENLDEWDREVFRARQGPELWWPFLLGVLVLLVAESLMAASRGVVEA